MMKRILIGVALIAVVLVGALAWTYLRPPEEASAPIEAIPIAAEATTESTATVAEPAEDEVAEDEVAEDVVEEAVAEESVNATEAVSETTVEADASTEAAVFEIVPAQSEARFRIEEVLNGAPFTAVGTTDQVAGQIAVNVDDPAATQLGVIQINVRTLATESEFRDRAIKNEILNTNDYEFVTFEPTEITGLPQSVSVGESFSFQIAGSLTVRDVMQPAIFDATVTPTSESQLEGTATTTILYQDYNISIPEARSVASVEDEVVLELDFVAEAV